MSIPVSITRCPAYKIHELETAVAEAIEQAGGLDVRGKRVLLKPNILRDAAAERAISTHPEFVRAVIRYVKSAGAARIMVGDSPGVHRGDFDGRSCGIRQVTDEEQAEWVDFKRGKREFEVDSPLIESSFQLTAVLDEADVIISLPKLKTHEFMYYTGAMKNLYGLIPGYAKAGLHVKYPGRKEFAQMLVDLQQALQKTHSVFAVMDAVIGMEGPGPGNGFPRSVGAVLASGSCFALDLAASRLIGYDPNSIPALHSAYGVLDKIQNSEDYELRGLSIEQARPERFELAGGSRRDTRGGPRRGPLARFLLRFRFFKNLEIRSRPAPQFDHTKCIRCGECVAICASRALTFSEVSGHEPQQRMIQLDESKCIRCYCCHEICPVEAITIPR
ncbi:MAG: DUF362 domain-containing protein [Spirochaetota bacterium]